MAETTYTWELLDGSKLTFPMPGAEQVAHLDRARQLYRDEGAGEDEIARHVFLEGAPDWREGAPGRVLRDLVLRKAIQRNEITARDVERARHTVTVNEVVDALGVSKAAIYKALKEGRLAGEKIDGHWRSTPQAVRAYAEGSPVISAPAGGLVMCRLGSAEGLSWRMKAWGADLEPIGDKIGGALTGSYYGWEKIAVISGIKGDQSYRYYELSPTLEPDKIDEIHLKGQFWARGPFDVGEIAYDDDAHAAWRAFKAEAVEKS